MEVMSFAPGHYATDAMGSADPPNHSGLCTVHPFRCLFILESRNADVVPWEMLRFIYVARWKEAFLSYQDRYTRRHPVARPIRP